jgi:hypothetical protein
MPSRPHRRRVSYTARRPSDGWFPDLERSLAVGYRPGRSEAGIAYRRPVDMYELVEMPALTRCWFRQPYGQ